MVPTLLGLRVFFAKTLAVVGIGILLLAPLAVLGNQGAEQNGTVGSSHLAAHAVAVQSRGAPHAPIHISGNDDFASQAANESWPGDGTEQNPYIIAGYEIDANGGTYCIWIENTDVWFIVRDCKVWNATNTASEPYGTGIYLYNVSHGTLANNNCSGNSKYGIYLGSSSNNTLTNNICFANSWSGGISLASGIFLASSNSNHIRNNNCSSNSDNGIYLEYSSNNKIMNNTCSQNSHSGIRVEYSSNNIIDNNTCFSNNIRGIYTSDSNTTLNNNSCYSNGCGMEITGSQIIIMHNNCSCNYGVGIDLYTSNSVIAYNDLYRNGGYAIKCGGTHNQIHHNNFIENNGATGSAIPYSQCEDFRGDNLWYDPETKEGNYWSNWNGKGAYKIDGYGEDIYPLEHKIGEESLEWLYWLIAVIVIIAIVICIAIFVVRRHKKKQIEVATMEDRTVELGDRETAVPVVQGEEMVCSRCGASIPGDANYCPFCASKVR